MHVRCHKNNVVGEVAQREEDGGGAQGDGQGHQLHHHRPQCLVLPGLCTWLAICTLLLTLIHSFIHSFIHTFISTPTILLLLSFLSSLIAI